MSGSSKKAVVVALISNFAIVVVKFIAFFMTGSASMFSEALHSTADTSNQALLMVGMSRSDKPSDKIHPFGYGGERYFVGFVVAVVLFSLGAITSINEGMARLSHPTEFSSPYVALAVLGMSLVLESISLAKAISESKGEMKSNESIFRFAKRTKIAELPVVLAEDIGGIAGLLVALAGTLLTIITGNEIFDAAGSIGIGVLLGLIAIFLGLEMKSLLLGEAADPTVEAWIHAAILSNENIRGIAHLRTLHLGPTDLLVAAKVFFDSNASLSNVAAQIDLIEAEIRSKIPMARLIYLESDVRKQYQDHNQSDSS